MMAGLDGFRQVEAALWRSVGVQPTERFLTLRTGGRVRVQELGEGSPVLFVHGTTVAGSSWCQLASALPGFRCILVDRPGCGLSDPLPQGSISDLAGVLAYADDLVADLLDALDLGRAHLASTSYAGLFAFRGAARHPDRVDRIVQYSWPMGAPMDKVPLSMRIVALPGMRSLSTKMPISPRLVKMLLSQVGLERAIDTGAFTHEHLDWTVSLLRDTDTLANDLHGSPDAVTPLRGLNKDLLLTDDDLRRVTMPTLLLWGVDDPNGGRSVAEAFSARLPNSRLELLEQAGHAPWIDRPDHCATETARFLGP